MKPGQSYFFLLVAAFFSGCGTVYVNEEDRNLDGVARDSFAVERSVDGAYREVYARLQHCVSAYGYRVRGNINRERDVAEVTVDSGFGFDRSLYLADSIFLKAELERLAPERTRITFILPTSNARPFADAVERWLISGDGSCRA
ncbi:MAG TPA: hypothetical protein VLS27_13275 [Gammaproteobacteria bacterium]|nr:hypothetical protein [Gammaproteobacteria bacterium]